MMKNTINSFLVSCCLLVVGFSPYAYAQVNVIAPPGVDEQITIKTVPEKPQPNESVTVTVESYTSNINKAYIAWSINGVVKEEGPGKTSFVFSTGKSGTVQTVNVTITTEDLRVISRSFTFAPAKVGLVVEADTYTPAFYKGKALFTPEASLKVVAFPEFVTDNGYKIPADNLVYTWRVDGEVIQSASGYGKAAFNFEGNLIPRPFTVSVEVTAYNSPLTAVQVIQVRPVEPEILVYEDNLLYGAQRDVAFTSGIYLYGKETLLRAEPYYISANVADSADLSYVWMLNGETVSSLTRPNVLGLENRTGQSGVASLNVSIEHMRKLLQAPSASLQIEFFASEQE
jgi:hypothetical protein